jgi:membrane associated rhomboid family serine protease
MGLESRDYFRDGSYTDRLTSWVSEITPVVKYLIILNVAVWIAQILVTRAPDAEEPKQSPQDWQNELQLKAREKQKAEDAVIDARAALKQAKGDQAEIDKRKADLAQKEAHLEEVRKEYNEVVEEGTQRFAEGGYGFSARESIVQEWLELKPSKVKHGQVWRLLTAAFCHHRFMLWHILFNMVLLYWFGTRLEQMYGSREFLLFYLAAAVCGSAAYVGLSLWSGTDVPAVGASGAIMGVMMLYVIFYPFERFYVFWFIPVPLWILLGLYVLYDVHPVLLALAGHRFSDGVAHAGHLGGLAFGWLYWKCNLRLEAVFGRRWKGTRPQRKPWRPRPAYDGPALLPFQQTDAFRERVDEVLKKISEQGQASLTDEERQVLIQASEKFRNKK